MPPFVSAPQKLGLSLRAEGEAISNSRLGIASSAKTASPQ